MAMKVFLFGVTHFVIARSASDVAISVIISFKNKMLSK
jgi:hypothetical protein